MIDASASYPSPPGSPSSKDRVNRGKTSEIGSSQDELNTTALKALLGLSSWQCGAISKSDKPCGWQILKKHRRRIDTHLCSMLTLDQSSPRLQYDLEKLIGFVHCHHHQHGPPRQIRLDEWISVFPSPPDQPSLRPLVERQIAKCFGRPTTTCMGTSRKGIRCNKTIGGQKVANCTKTISQICDAEVYLSDIKLDHYLQVLAVNVCCHFHTDQSLSKNVPAWKEKILAIRNEADLGPTDLQHKSTTRGSEKQIPTPNRHESRHASVKEEQRKSSKGQDRKITLPCPSTDCLGNPHLHWPSQYDETPLKIVKRSESPNDHTTSYHDIRRQMMDALDDEDKKDGFLYIYEVKGNKGFVKIGYTTRSINKRHDEWTFDCNRELVSLFPIGATEARRVPHAHRVEKLCHAELSYRNNVIYCDGCLKEHFEWFEVSPSEAIAVVRKWTTWIETKPYLFDGSLKEEEARKSADIDRFMDTMSKNTGDIRTSR
ncbi:hypothetical protein G4B11_005760 [Aspergillus flavus]|nr:hypothetical protein G4B11_005760 [Aspergillus flavus]